MTKDNNFRLEFPTDTEVMGADMSEPPKPPTVASQESDVNGVSDFSVFEDYGDYSNEIPVPPKNTGKIVAIVIAAIVVIALIGGIACWMLSNNLSKSHTESETIVMTLSAYPAQLIAHHLIGIAARAASLGHRLLIPNV